MPTADNLAAVGKIKTTLTQENDLKIKNDFIIEDNLHFNLRRTGYFVLCNENSLTRSSTLVSSAIADMSGVETNQLKLLKVVKVLSVGQKEESDG